MVTNLFMQCEGEYNFKERYLMPEHRQVLEALTSIADELKISPIIIKGKDGFWWNEDLVFVLERMLDEINTPVLKEIKNDIMTNSWEEGETRVYRTEKVKLTVTADATPMMDGDLDEEYFKEIDKKEISESSVSEDLKTEIETLKLSRYPKLFADAAIRGGFSGE